MRLRAFAVVYVLVALSCGAGSGDVYHPGDVSADSHPDSGPSVADSGLDSGSPDASSGADMAQVPQPRPLRPCSDGDCWETTLSAAPCFSASHDEDYSSGTYNAHAYSTTLWAGIPATITVTRTGGDWVPTIVLLAADGAVLWDGETARSGTAVDVAANGRADLVVSSADTAALTVVVTSRAAADDSFQSRIPQDATYEISIAGDCGGSAMSCRVNGYDVIDKACGWLNYVGRRVVPLLPGSRDERLDLASMVAWWSLKEGVLYVANPLSYSNCNFPTGDEHIGPVDTCVEGRAWQVGLAAVQVTYNDLGEAEALATQLYPGSSVEDVLSLTAREAGLDSADTQTVLAATGELRKSWLLRNSLIGFVLEEPAVQSWCFGADDQRCFGSGYTSTQRYAPNRAAAERSIADIRVLFDALAP